MPHRASSSVLGHMGKASTRGSRGDMPSRVMCEEDLSGWDRAGPRRRLVSREDARLLEPGGRASSGGMPGPPASDRVVRLDQAGRLFLLPRHLVETMRSQEWWLGGKQEDVLAGSGEVGGIHFLLDSGRGGGPDVGRTPDPSPTHTSPSCEEQGEACRTHGFCWLSREELRRGCLPKTRDLHGEVSRCPKPWWNCAPPGA